MTLTLSLINFKPPSGICLESAIGFCEICFLILVHLVMYRDFNLMFLLR